MPPAKRESVDPEFVAFYRSTVDFTANVARRASGGDRQVAEDATQTAYAEMLGKWPDRRRWSWQDNRQYVAGIAVHKVMDWFRNHQRWAEFDLRCDAATDEPGFTEVLDEMSIMREVRAVISAQPARRRAVGVLYFLLGYNYAEIAEELEITQSTVRTQVSRLRELLLPCVERANEFKRGGERP